MYVFLTRKHSSQTLSLISKGEEETTATATGTESDSGGRDSESEEEEEELYGEADDDEEMLANKVVDKFLAGPIARATSQSIQDLLVSGHVQMTRRQRLVHFHAGA